MGLAGLMKALSDETRLRILNLLYHEELCVGELEILLDINQSNTSRHLKRLADAKVLIAERRAQFVYYKVSNNLLKDHIFIENLLKHELMKMDQCKVDLARLKEYKGSGFSCEDLKAGRVSFCNLPPVDGF